MFKQRVSKKQQKLLIIKQEIADAKLLLKLHETQPITQESIRKYQLRQMIVERYQLGFYFDSNNEKNT